MGKISSETHALASSATDVLQEEIRHTEAEITDTLQSIEAKLAPERIKEQVKGKVVHGTVNAVVRTGYAIKRKPGPSAAVAAGLFLLLKTRARRRARARAGALSAAMLEALPREVRRNPAKTFRTYFTLGRMAFAFISVASAVLLRGKRAQQALDRQRALDFEMDYPVHLSR